MSNPITDNRTPETSTLSWLKTHLRAGARLRVASAYFTVGAFGVLKKELGAIETMRFLFGDPGFLERVDETKEVASFVLQDGTLKLNGQLKQNTLALECAAWMRERVAIRSIRSGRLSHGKLYHLEYPNPLEAFGKSELKNAALVGSSNFTVSGLGAGKLGGNLELNLEAYDDRDRDALAAWFDGLWQNEEFTRDVKDEVLGYLERLARDNSPEFVYYKTLFHLFESKIGAGLDDEVSGQQKWRESQIWQALYSFQKHGAKGVVQKLEAYGGCILADSVGLGKTFEALAVIWYFENVLRQRVLVLAPKKLRENWRVFQGSEGSVLNPFPRDGFRFALKNHTDLGLAKEATFDWNQYGLIVIDESHNFRNNAKGKDGKKSRYEWLMESVIQSGAKTKVLLLSATPVNTDLKDLRNQIAFMTEDNDSAFAENMGISSVSALVGRAQKEFIAWSAPSPNPSPASTWRGENLRDPKELMARLPAPFFTLLDELSIARSRRHIEKFYAGDLKTIGAFPARAKPLSMTAPIDSKGRFPSYDKLHRDISQYKLHLFNPSFYLKPEARDKYEARQAQAENHLIGMMRVNFLKRLESSVASFAQTMERTIAKIESLEARIERFERFQAENPHVSSGGLFESELEEIEDDELREAFEVSAGRFNLADLRLDDWKRALQEDKQQLSGLALAAQAVTPQRDAKLAALKAFIEGCIADKSAPHERKIVVFTAFADTARYLYDNIAGWAKTSFDLESGLVVGSGANAATWGHSEFNEILFNFAPVSKKRAQVPTMAQDREISILIATDCISEGQNLQDCGVVVNYDIHWNPVRLIQRFGRIDRLGSLHSTIQMVNFWPTDDLNEYINLKNRVEARMALVDVAGTGQDNILRGMIERDLTFRDEQLKKLQTETPDLEEMEGGVSLSDFTLDDFVSDLGSFLQTRRKEIEGAPNGIFAVVPQSANAKPGLVFCLKKRGEAQKGRAGQGRFALYYLVYIREDGEVALSYTDDKRLLSLLRAACQGHHEPIDALCRAFENETRAGENLGGIYDLLLRVVAHIGNQSQQNALKSLAKGGVLAAKAQERDDEDDWDLMTWFVIR